MRKTFTYRLYPSHGQETLLTKSLDECRWLYNHLLEARKTAWEQRQQSLSLYEQQATLPALKADRPALKAVYSQVLQNVAVRIDLGMKAFFRRVKAGETPGYPRFRGRNRSNSVTYPQADNGCIKIDHHRLYASGLGKIKIIYHRPLEGQMKTATIACTATGKWFVAIVCEVPDPAPLPLTGAQVGIDVGLKTFAYLSTDEAIDNPRFFRQDEAALAKVQRRFSKDDKGTPERAKRRRPVARVHERIAWRRSDFTHQHSRRIVNRFDLIGVEDLSINRMLHTHCLAKSISDAAWGQFAALLLYKAAWAGRKFVAVNPAYTSQDCSSCGHRQKMPLSERTYTCPCCGLVIDRDLNAARNILGVGLHTLAPA
jgi:putative transposase